MKEKIFSYLTGIFAFLLAPYLAAVFVNGPDMALLVRGMDVESCLPVMVSMEISGDYGLETIKSQTVVVRTNLYRRLEGENPGKVLGEMLGEAREAYGYWYWPREVYERAASETEGVVLSHKGKLKLVPYHEISGGQTRDGAEAFHDEAFSYLKGVDSSFDKKSPDYLNSTYISPQQLPKELEVWERDEAGYVMSLLADGRPLEGEAFRRGMGLSSGSFTIQEIGAQVRFLCKGRGHGLGFSQYGGEMLAQNGENYETILSAYFPEMDLVEVSRILGKA